MTQPDKSIARSKKRVYFILAIPVVILVVYGLLASSASILTGENSGTHLLVICFIIAVLLLVPYLILKAGFHAAHMSNPKQKELKLEDIPKSEKPPYTGA